MSEDLSKRPKKRRSSILKPCTDQNIIRTETAISRRVSFSRSKNVQEYIVDNPPVESAYAESYYDDISSLRHTEDEDSKALSLPSSIEGEDSLCDKSVFAYHSDESDLDITQKSLINAASDGNVLQSMNMEMTGIGNEDFVDNIENLISQEAEKSFAILDTSHDKGERSNWISNQTVREPCGMDITTMFTSETKVYTQEEYNKENEGIRSRHLKKVSSNKTLRESMGMDFTITSSNQLNTTQKNKTMRESIGMDLTVVDHDGDLIEDCEEERHYNTGSPNRNKTLKESVGMELTMSVENDTPADKNLSLDTDPINNPPQRDKTMRESIGMNFTLGAVNNTLVVEDSNPNIIHKPSGRNKTLRESIGMDMTMGAENNSLADEEIGFNLIQKHSLKDKTLRESVGMNMTLAAGKNTSLEKEIKSKTKFIHNQSSNDVAMNITGVESGPTVCEDINSRSIFNHESSQNNKTHKLEQIGRNMSMGVENHITVDENKDSLLNFFHKQSQKDKTIRESVGMNITMGAESNSSVEEDMDTDHMPDKIHNSTKRNKTVRESMAMDFTIANGSDSFVGEAIDPHFKTASKKLKGQKEYLNSANQRQNEEETELETSIQTSKEEWKETMPMDILSESSLHQNDEKLSENIEMEYQNRLVESEDVSMKIDKVNSKTMKTNLVNMALPDSAPNKDLSSMKIILNKSESTKISMNSEVNIDSQQPCQSPNRKSEENEIYIDGTSSKSKHNNVNVLETLHSPEKKAKKMMDVKISNGKKLQEVKNSKIPSMKTNEGDKSNGDDCLSGGQIKKRKVDVDEESYFVKDVIATEVGSSNLDSQMLTDNSSKNEGRVSNPGHRSVELQKMERTENGLQKDIADDNAKVYDEYSCPKREFYNSKELEQNGTGKSSNIPIPISDNPGSETSNLIKSEQNSENLVSVREVNLNETQNTSVNDTQESGWISQVETPPCNRRLSGLYYVNSSESSFSDTYNSFRIATSLENTPQSKESKTTKETLNVFQYYEKEQINFNDNYKYANYSISSLSDDAALLSFMQGKFILTFDIEPLNFVEDKGDYSVSHWTVKQISGQIHYTKSDPFVNLVLDLVDEVFHQNRMLADACHTTMSFKDFLGHIRPQISNACMMIINETKIFHSHPCSGLDSKNPRIYLIHFSGFCFNFSVEINFEKGLDLVRESVSCTVSEGPVNVNFILNLASKSKRSWMFLKDYIKNVDLYVKHMDLMYLKSLGLVS